MCFDEAAAPLLQHVDAGSGESDEEDGLCEYEKQRLKKIKENRAFLASLNLVAAKEDLKAVTKKQVKVCKSCQICAAVCTAAICACVFDIELSWKNAATD